MINVKSVSIDYLRERLYELNERNNDRIEKRMSKIGINKISLSKESLIFGIMLVGILDQQNNITKARTLHLAWKLINKIGDIATSIKSYTDEEHVFLAFSTIKQAKSMSEAQIRKISKTVSIIAKWIINSNTEDLTDLSWSLVNIIKDETDQYTSPEYDEKRQTINDIISNGKPKNQKDAFNILRQALSALPGCNLEFADIVIWQITMVYGLWESVHNEIRIPITNSLLRPLTELGFITQEDAKIPDKERISMIVKKISVELFPENPKILSALELVGKYWCGNKVKYCSSCPLYIVCPRLV
ncbi:MAG: hypothetical protein QW128_01565 [Thermoprotei archaeon]